MAEKFELTDEMRAQIGRESPPWTMEVTTTSVRAFARGVGYTDPVYFDMASMSPRITSLLADVTSVAYVGILEEHRFYVRQMFDTGPNRTLDAAHRFSRARVFPGTDRPWRGLGDDSAVGDPDHPSWSMDVADNIMDLQVALAFDSPRGGGSMSDDFDDVGNDDRIFESAGFSWRDAGCSSCLAMNPDVIPAGERCASTSNRNYEGRQGRGARTHLVSPAMAAAAAVSGRFVDVREWESS